MQDGNWRYTADPIRFDAHGNLVDGQHRLLAIVKSGCPQMMLIVRGFESGTKFDAGKPRTHADDLTMRGVENAGTVSAIARELYGYECGAGSKNTPLHGPAFSGDSNRVSRYGLDKILIENPDIFDITKIIRSTEAFREFARLLSGSGRSGFFLLMAMRENEWNALTFAEYVGAGANTSHTSGIPIMPTSAPHHLRSILIKSSLSRSKEATTINPRVRLAWCIKAWKLYKQGRKLKTSKSILWRFNAKPPEPFPMF